MAELGHNYNIQCMKLFQELKAAHPATPDEVVRQCMKLNRNAKGKCMEDLDLANGSQKHFLGRYNQALLSHQMNQLFKLEHELRLEKIDLDHEKVEVQDLEMEVKQRALKTQFVEVKKLEHDIGDLRGSVDNMVKKVTDLTGGKVPLGEDSITDYKPYLSQEPAVPDAPHCDVAPVFRANPDPSAPAHADKWSCSECTFANHPSLDTCEMCEMPRINMVKRLKLLQSIELL